MEKYGVITKDNKIEMEVTNEQYLKPSERIDTRKTAEVKSGYKPIRFASLPKFNQETQAVFQTAPVDKGEYIEAGVVVVDLPPEIDPIFDEPIKEEPVIKK